MNELEEACTERVRDQFLPELERIAIEVLGSRPGGTAWMEFQVDAITHSPVVLFYYPSTGTHWIRVSAQRSFREDGVRITHRPKVTRRNLTLFVRGWKRNFRNSSKISTAIWWRWNWNGLSGRRPLFCTRNIIAIRRIRSATVSCNRHYSDMSALARHGVAQRALVRDDLRQRVASWKSRVFASTRARYDLARPGTFRLAPPEDRLAGLKKDYQAMKDMFLITPPPFESVIRTVSDLEQEINKKGLV